ncbi:MAG: Rpn family recombination-promoting nuclease/putative transposase [Lachnospiraceae bacterium]|nr:Rpn family recombination-promoting nuclease/putative transposase [Lachnospiraceae bacterium]
MGELRKMKKYEELKFQDDFMFGKVMEDMELSRDLLQCLLQKPVGEMTAVQTQREFGYVTDGKPIRLDVYNIDSNNVIYDTEIENLNHKSVESHELPKRSRFYQASIDIDYLDKGETYSKLPDSNVMFICTFDPFGKGYGVYTFNYTCKENQEIQLKDGATRVFYNCTYEGEDLPEDIKKFYKYIRTGKSESALTERIDEAVVKCRQNEIWRTQYMKERVVIMDAREEGREEERESNIEKLAAHFVSENKDLSMEKAREKAKAILK